MGGSSPIDDAQLPESLRDPLPGAGPPPAVPAKAALKEGCTDRVPMPPPERTIIEGNSPKRGPAGSPVTIVEFTDYECPFCRKFSDTVLTLEKLCARHSSSSMAGRWSGRSQWRISSRSSTKSSPRKSVRALQTRCRRGPWRCGGRCLWSPNHPTRRIAAPRFRKPQSCGNTRMGRSNHRAVAVLRRVGLPTDSVG
jgi:hypothetical protein